MSLEKHRANIYYRLSIVIAWMRVLDKSELYSICRELAFVNPPLRSCDIAQFVFYIYNVHLIEWKRLKQCGVIGSFPLVFLRIL